MCDSSLGLLPSPPKLSMLACMLSVYHTCPGPTATLSNPSMPFARYILKLCSVTRLARSLSRVFSSSCNGINASTSLSPSYSNG